MITWNTSKPNGHIILARMVNSWYPRYKILYFHSQKKMYFDENGDEVPYSAITHWISIESEKET